MKELSEYNNTVVRVLCNFGECITGQCEWNPPYYWYGPDGCSLGSESLKIGDTIIFADQIKEIEILREEVCIPVRDWPEAKEEIISWFCEKRNVPPQVCRQSITECIGTEEGVPQWYVVVRKNRIIAGCGVIADGFHERKDLTPNVCAVYVEEEHRRRGVAGFMLQFVCYDMAEMGYDTLYLPTGLDGFYERYGWEFLCEVRGNDGALSRMYAHTASQDKRRE